MSNKLSSTPTPSITLSVSPKPTPMGVSKGLLAIWHGLTASKKVTIGSTIIAFFLLVAFAGPFFLVGDPGTLSDLTLTPPSSSHWLGTTQLGQDVFSELIAGTRTSIFWGVVTGLAVAVISIAVGLVGGYFGGAVDDILTLLTNIFLVLPPLPLAIVLATYFARGEFTVALVITITSWAWGARVLRAQTLSMRTREFVAAARAGGENALRIIFCEIFPNEISIVAANFVSTTLYVIIAAASLQFLGLGDSTTISWGSMLYWAQKTNALLLGAWWWFVPPGLCIAVLAAGLAFINFGIDEVADPRLRSERLPKEKREDKAVA